MPKQAKDNTAKESGMASQVTNHPLKHPAQRVGVFIDVQNLYYSAKNLFEKKVDFGNIVKDGVSNRQLIRSIAYVVRTESGDELPFFEALYNLGLETRERDLLTYHGGNKKADWDVGIAIDIIRMIESLDVIILVSGDGDFIPLVEYAQNRGRQMEVMSFRETTSTRLVEEVDCYTNLSDDLDRYLIKDSTAKRSQKR